MAFARLGAYNNGCKWLSKVIHRQWNSWLQLTAGAYSMHYYAIRKTGAIVADNYILRNNINLYIYGAQWKINNKMYSDFFKLKYQSVNR
jgi:hypothetical protein